MNDAAVQSVVGQMAAIIYAQGRHTQEAAVRAAAEMFTLIYGAGRTMGRREAERRFSVEQHALATSGIECDKTASTLDETPACYKDIDSVMAAQSDLVEIVHTLKQFVNVKGQK
jgi:tRNA-splicing ligase RtcB